ncbi:MAG: tRNA (adenosine(37)-N6)-threonylcarbamoyltransferase complex ATPase subunit type 1 TsaE [Parcubacteria group bacterium]|nr:tRNA (adenosine(37)-N6)-threonylcarbamoyltransferase complex ATPase subunit type 1 TsaE [Parcubacteria group bacterium]
MRLKIISQNAKETQKIAFILGQAIRKEKGRRTARVIALEGNLGSGKTIFTQGLAKGLKVKGRVLSPTFILMRPHQLGKFQGCFYHIDSYRLKGETDLLNLDFETIFKEPKNIIVIEWPGRVKKILPQDAIWIKFKIIGKLKREISFLIK